MTKEVKYGRTVKAQAMSKSPYQVGLILIDDKIWGGDTGETVSLHSMNAKDGKQTSYLRLQIPKEHIDEVIEALKQFR